MPTHICLVTVTTIEDNKREKALEVVQTHQRVLYFLLITIAKRKFPKNKSAHWHCSSYNKTTGS
jgi:hypothetical protein